MALGILGPTSMEPVVMLGVACASLYLLAPGHDFSDAFTLVTARRNREHEPGTTRAAHLLVLCLYLTRKYNLSLRGIQPSPKYAIALQNKIMLCKLFFTNSINPDAT